MTLSTRDLSSLPDVPRLEALMQSLAMLDAILSPEWDYRYYSFNAHWNVGERMGSMRNGTGDELFALFGPDGCFVKGFDHEAWNDSVPAERFYRHVPPVFANGVAEPAFSPDLVTFCLWRQPGDPEWKRAAVAEYLWARDGSEELLRELDGDPASYVRFAADYFEVGLDPGAVAAIYGHAPLTEEAALRLSPAVDYAALKEEAAEIGYPVAG